MLIESFKNSMKLAMFVRIPGNTLYFLILSFLRPLSLIPTLIWFKAPFWKRLSTWFGRLRVFQIYPDIVSQLNQLSLKSTWQRWLAARRREHKLSSPLPRFGRRHRIVIVSFFSAFSLPSMSCFARVAHEIGRFVTACAERSSLLATKKKIALARPAKATF